MELSTEGIDPALGAVWVGKGVDEEVIFRDMQSHLIAVPVHAQGTSFSPGAPRLLLGGRSLASSRFIDVTRSGQRILLGLPQENAQHPSHAAAELDRKSKALTLRPYAAACGVGFHEASGWRLAQTVKAQSTERNLIGR